MKEKILSVTIIGLMILAGIGIINTETVARGPPEQGPPGNSILDVAVAVNSEGPYEGSFDILIAAVSETPCIANKLDGNGQHTVFAPTYAAFEALAEELGFEEVDELVAFLLENPNYLKNVLKYHITHGRLYAEDVVIKDQLNTLIRGRNGFLEVDETVLTDNLGREANIIITNVEAANGIIHVIDAVVLPYAP
ncbi:MAG: fasciclin domain-containing protein [Thermoplasmatota archaeon]